MAKATGTDSIGSNAHSKSAGPLSSKGKEAGASCVGMGSNLFPKDVVKAGDWATVTKLCSESLKIIAEVRQ